MVPEMGDRPAARQIQKKCGCTLMPRVWFVSFGAVVNGKIKVVLVLIQ
jgi:hypothetical protein